MITKNCIQNSRFAQPFLKLDSRSRTLAPRKSTSSYQIVVVVGKSASETEDICMNHNNIRCTHTDDTGENQRP